MESTEISPRKPTEMQLRYLINRVKTNFDKKKLVWCLIDAGYKPGKQPHALAWQIENSVAVRDQMQLYMDGDPRLTIQALVRKTGDLLNAKHPFRPNRPDNTEQRKTLEMAYKLRDVFPAKKLDIKKVTKSFNLNVDVAKRAQEIRPDEKVFGYVDAEEVEEDGDNSEFNPL